MWAVVSIITPFFCTFCCLFFRVQAVYVFLLVVLNIIKQDDLLTLMLHLHTVVQDKDTHAF